MYISWDVIGWMSVVVLYGSAIYGMAESVERGKRDEREGRGE